MKSVITCFFMLMLVAVLQGCISDRAKTSGDCYLDPFEALEKNAPPETPIQKPTHKDIDKLKQQVLALAKECMPQPSTLLSDVEKIWTLDESGGGQASERLLAIRVMHRGVEGIYRMNIEVSAHLALWVDGDMPSGSWRDPKVVRSEIGLGDLFSPLTLLGDDGSLYFTTRSEFIRLKHTLLHLERLKAVINERQKKLKEKPNKRIHATN